MIQISFKLFKVNDKFVKFMLWFFRENIWILNLTSKAIQSEESSQSVREIVLHQYYILWINHTVIFSIFLEENF